MVGIHISDLFYQSLKEACSQPISFLLIRSLQSLLYHRRQLPLVAYQDDSAGLHDRNEHLRDGSSSGFVDNRPIEADIRSYIAVPESAADAARRSYD